MMLVGCGPSEKASQDDSRSSRPVVVSANYPLHCFARRIGGDAVESVFLVTPGVDPAFWEPNPADISRMQQADVILLNGAGYEQWLTRVSLPDSKRVDTSAGFRAQFIEAGEGPMHQHGPSGEHSHGALAFTTWMDLSLAAEQAAAITRALATVLPGNTEALQTNLSELTTELAGYDQALAAWSDSLEGRPVIGSHPVYQYFARRYGLNLRSLHWEPGEVPDEAAWRELDRMLQEHPARLMLWEGEPMEAAVSGLAERGVKSVVVNPCANVPGEGDFFSVMQQTLMNLTEGD